MSDWLALAKAKAWNEIFTHKLSEAELVELSCLLRKTLPRTTRGHGLSARDGPILPRHAMTLEEHDAARLLVRVERILNTRAQLSSEPIQTARKRAVEALAACGVIFEGLDDTYLYWYPAQRKWCQVMAATAQALVQRRVALEEKLVELPPEQRNLAYADYFPDSEPELHCYPLALLFRTDSFDEYTTFWHAVNALDLLEAIESFGMELEARLHRSKARSDILEKVSLICGHAISVGAEIEALDRKAVEPHAIRGIGTLRASHNGGEARKRANEQGSKATLEEMARLIDSGHSVLRASELCAKKFPDRNSEAIRKAWNRSAKKAGTTPPKSQK